MKVTYSAFLVLVVLMPRCVHCLFDPFTIAGLGIAAVGTILYGVMYVEQCGSEWIKPDLKALNDDLDKKLYGQHLVKNVVITALEGHFEDENPPKALVISFHGWTGNGKNYVSSFIANNLYSLGRDSHYVHTFISTIDFPHEHEVNVYKSNLKNWIIGNVTKCHRTLFIFDEIDKMPKGTIDVIKPFIDYHENIYGVDFRKSIFLFLSNTGGTKITKWMLEQWKNGKNRDNITMQDIAYIIEKGAFNEIGGLHQSDIIQSNLVNYYIPFLPLERKHVELCVKDELNRRNRAISKEKTKTIIKRVADKIKYFPPEIKLFSKTGCKGIHDKVWTAFKEDAYDSGTLFD